MVPGRVLIAVGRAAVPTPSGPTAASVHPLRATGRARRIDYRNREGLMDSHEQPVLENFGQLVSNSSRVRAFAYTPRHSGTSP